MLDQGASWAKGMPEGLVGLLDGSMDTLLRSAAMLVGEDWLGGIAPLRSWYLRSPMTLVYPDVVVEGEGGE